MRTLKTLPKTLNDTYLRILCGIEEEDRNDAIKVLQWLTFSARPMLLDEVAEVVAIDHDEDPEFDTSRRLRSPHDILTVCSSLVVISSLEQIVDSQFVFKDAIALAHLSVKDYLTSGRILSSDVKDFQISRKSAHRCIAEMCLSYLAVNGPTLNDKNVMQYPLSRYAAEYWIEHVLEAGEKDMCPRIKVLFTSSEFITSWVRLYDPDYPFEDSDISRDEATIAGPLYYASLCGLADTARDLLATGADPNEKGALYFDPLEAAASKGHDNIVQTLLENGALLRTDAGVYGSALQAATMMGHTKVALTILRHESVVPQMLLNACLCLAAQSGNTEMTVLFIQYGADINYEDPTHGSSLRVAARGGHENTVQTLLQKGASVNIKGGKAASALEGAARQAHERIVHLLIAAEADVNLGGGRHGNPLQAAARSGHTAIVRALLENGAKPNARGGEYGTALQAAARNGNVQVVQMLINAGAQANTCGGLFGNALCAAAYFGNAGVVTTLLEHGADSELRFRDKTPLDIAKQQEYNEVIRILREHETCLRT